MEKSKVEMFMGMKAEYFDPMQIAQIKEKVEAMDDSKFIMLQSLELRKPSVILLIAIFLGWERFLLDDIGLGIVKVVTCYGCGIWWLVDVISAKKRAQKYNYEKFMKMTSMM